LKWSLLAANEARWKAWLHKVLPLFRVPKNVHAVMAKIDSRFGRLDVLVHCAAVV